jgi:hypothetical protein
MKEWMMMIQNIGFPIVVTLYLLHRIERKLDEVTTAILTLPQSLIRRTPERRKSEETEQSYFQ